MIGWKIVSKNRKSPVPPAERMVSHCGRGPQDTGTVLVYPPGRIVRAKSFCDCAEECCKGIHFYRTKSLARDPLHDYGNPNDDFIIKIRTVGRVKRGLQKCRAEAVEVLS